jgi:hypothetical protein
VAFFVAAYTLTAHGDGTRSLRIAVAGLAVLMVGWILTADTSRPGQLGWLLFRIGTAIMATILAFNLLGDALADALDPRHWR